MTDTRRYHPYLPLREVMASKARREGGLPKSVKTQKFVDECVRELCQDNAFTMSMGCGILMDEEDWVQTGCRVYFPQDAEFLDMLWRAKMDLLPSDVRFPKAFSIAWPSDFAVDGIKLPGVLAWWGTVKERNELWDRFGKKYVREEVRRWNPRKEEGEKPEDKMLLLAYQDPSPDVLVVSYRCAMPEAKVALCLKSEQEMHDAIGLIGGLGVWELSQEELKRQYILAKMVVHLMVYGTACPDKVVPGWPDKFRDRECSTGWMPPMMPSRITMPAVPRGSPEAHWRTWHFRRYPQKRDGSRKDGVVFVSGCLVAGGADPMTVLD